MLLDILGVGKPDADLGAFDADEADDLPLHVRQCGRRYRALDAKLNTAIRLILLLCILYAVNNLPAVKTLLGM